MFSEDVVVDKDGKTSFFTEITASKLYDQRRNVKAKIKIAYNNFMSRLELVLNDGNLIGTEQSEVIILSFFQ